MTFIPEGDDCEPKVKRHSLLDPGPIRVVDWERDETDTCEANTPGCCINHNIDKGGCECW